MEKLDVINHVDINRIIKKSNFFIDEINQLLHNHGIEFNSRLDIIMNYIHHKFHNKELNDGNCNVDQEVNDKIETLFDDLLLDKHELIQKVFMFYCDKQTKINLSQYYTPVTIGKFISALLVENKTLVDPACGTGDLVLNYNGDINVWDISEDVIEMCKFNCNLNDKDATFECVNSIKDKIDIKEQFDYCCLNPPFGTSTVINDSKLLDKYELGNNKKKEEIGILFIERAMQLLKQDGVAFIILPNGYLGNTSKNTIQLRKWLLTFRIIGIIELPTNTFARSGAGVSTSLMIIQKRKMVSNYNIFIQKVDNIGYLLNKKNTPYKYKCINGEYVLEDNKPILDNELDRCANDIKMFVKNEDINNLDCSCSFTNNTAYEVVKSDEIIEDILDINRYLLKYTNIVNRFIQNNCKKLCEYIVDITDTKFKIIPTEEYLYLDISQITTPLYKKGNMLYGSDLPVRAKHKLKKNDIIISKLKGKIAFTVILEDRDDIICTNGIMVLRPRNSECLLIIFANLFTDDFQRQHTSLCRGSILESITESEIKNIYVSEDIKVNDEKYKKYNALLEALKILMCEL